MRAARAGCAAEDQNVPRLGELRYLRRFDTADDFFQDGTLRDGIGTGADIHTAGFPYRTAHQISAITLGHLVTVRAGEHRFGAMRHVLARFVFSAPLATTSIVLLFAHFGVTLVTTSGGGLGGVVMAQVLRVDFVDMKMSSNLIDEHREDLRAAHAAADAAIEAAQSGWVGQSALALQEKLLELQGVTHHANNECDHHSTAITAISDKFQKIDEQEAIEIIRTRRSI